MADEKVTYYSILKSTFQGKGWFKKYALFTLVILTLGFVTIYLNFEIPFLGALLLIVFLIPLVITYTEYSALIETRNPIPRDFRGFGNLFTNTYRSGRVRVILTFKVILKYFLYMMLGMILSGFVFYLIIANYDAVLFSQIKTAIDATFKSETPELILANLEIVEGLLVNYEVPFFIVNQLMAMGILIFFVNQGIFRIFTSVFIQQQPMTSLDEINKRFFGDKKSKSLRIKANLINVLSVFLLYGLVYTGSFLLLYNFSESANIILQTDLISFLVLVGALPFVVRFNFFMYQALAKTKEVEIMEFTISELKSILRSPLIPEGTRPYIVEILKIKMSELARLKSIESPEQPKTVESHEVENVEKKEDGSNGSRDANKE